MIEDTIQKIEMRLRTNHALSETDRKELEQLLAQLRNEAHTLPRPPVAKQPVTEEDDAQSALGRLKESLTEFETTHPKLVGTVNRISTILANMGI
jgi:hypothetical protein